jgi:hypothetical protein
MKTTKFQPPAAASRSRALISSAIRRFNPLPLCLALLTVASAFGQNYSIDWYKVADGGGTSTGGTYAVSDTIGQPDAGGPITGGSYSLTGGFWALISLVQTAGAPTLYITHAGNTITVYWQNLSGWNLQQNGNLLHPSGWTVNSSWTTSNGTNYLNISAPTGSWFFRLQGQ